MWYVDLHWKCIMVEVWNKSDDDYSNWTKEEILHKDTHKSVSWLGSTKNIYKQYLETEKHGYFTKKLAK